MGLVPSRPRASRPLMLGAIAVALAALVVAGAVVVLANRGPSDSRPPGRGPNGLAPGASDRLGPATAHSAPPANPPAVLRGANSFTITYGSSDPSYRGEPDSSYRFLASRGMKLIRLPFIWDYVQRRLGGPLDPRYVKAIKREVRRIKAAGMYVVLDLHSDCRWGKDRSRVRVCGAGISPAQVGSVWTQLSRTFQHDSGVIAYDLMNEPWGIPAKTWEFYSQAMVDAIRARGDRKLLWIEGADFSKTSTWADQHPQPWIRDPANNIMYSAHQYFDPCGCYQKGFGFGSYRETTRTALDRLKVFTDWLARYGQRGSIGEVGWPSSLNTGDWKKWNRLGDEWYRAADAAGLWVTYFSATSAYDEKNVAYDAKRNRFNPYPGIGVAESQAPVIEAHPSR